MATVPPCHRATVWRSSDLNTMNVVFFCAQLMDIYSDEPLPGPHRVLCRSSPLTGRYSSTLKAHLSRVGVTIPLVSAFRPPHILNKTRIPTKCINGSLDSCLFSAFPVQVHFYSILDSLFCCCLVSFILWYPLPFPLFNWPFQTKINATEFDSIFFIDQKKNWRLCFVKSFATQSSSSVPIVPYSLSVLGLWAVWGSGFGVRGSRFEPSNSNPSAIPG